MKPRNLGEKEGGRRWARERGTKGGRGGRKGRVLPVGIVVECVPHIWTSWKGLRLGGVMASKSVLRVCFRFQVPQFSLFSLQIKVSGMVVL